MRDKAVRVSPVLAGPPHLTPTEKKVRRAFAYYDDDKQIAAALSVSPATIHSHVKSVFRKLGAKSRSVALALGLRYGLLTREDVTTSFLPPPYVTEDAKYPLNG